MIRRLIHRPIAVSLCIVAIIVVCLLGVSKLPVSLMPDIDIPRITVQASLPGASVREAEEKLAAPLRSQLMQVGGLKDLRSEARTDGASIAMEFEPEANMSLLFIEANEKVDRALQFLPDGLDRPKVVKAGAMDIPAFFLDISLRDDNPEEFLRLSSFVTGVARKRLEQLPQTAMVDISGVASSEIIVTPDPAKLSALGLTAKDIEKAISSADLQLEALSVVDGAYRYSLHFDSQLLTPADIRAIAINHQGRLLELGQLATVEQHPAPDAPVVRHGNAQAITLAIIKQNDARMDDLRHSVDALLTEFRADYPNVDFTLTRDQTQLLSYSISNLWANLAIGIALACLVLFAFMRNGRVSLLIIITIPLALVVTLLCFYLVGVSVNIVSLSGLVLGVGMMVDNSIIVIDNIMRKLSEGDQLDEAICAGAGEVWVPMLTSVLTTCSVFIPLIFLSGTAGALFYDQAMAVTVALFSSLAVAVLVIPVYFRLAFRKQQNHSAKALAYHKRLSGSGKSAAYNRMLQATLRHPIIAIAVLIVIVALGVIAFPHLRKERLPDVAHTDILASIDWNSGISTAENDRRCTALRSRIDSLLLTSTSMVGPQGFILSHTKSMGPSQAVLYLSARTPADVEQLRHSITEIVAAAYPEATVDFEVSGNIYDMIFSSGNPDLEIRLQNAHGALPTVAESRAWRAALADALPEVALAPVATDETIVYQTDAEAMARYQITYTQLYSRLRQLLGANQAYSINDGSQSVPVIVGADHTERFSVLQNTLRTADGVDVPLSLLLRERKGEDYKRLYASNSGAYYPIGIYADDATVERAIAYAKANGSGIDGQLTASLAGEYYDSRQMVGELAVILSVAIALLYFILAAQFESLLQPAIILSEVIIDIACVLIALWAIDESLNIMSMIGVVVMCGIVINDSILKIDTINRLRRHGMPLVRAIVTAGHQRLKPIVMTSLTTIIAIVPFLRHGDMGNDLQFPLSYVLITGMIAGTLVSLFAIPLLYYLTYHKQLNIRHQ